MKKILIFVLLAVFLTGIALVVKGENPPCILDQELFEESGKRYCVGFPARSFKEVCKQKCGNSACVVLEKFPPVIKCSQD